MTEFNQSQNGIHSVPPARHSFEAKMADGAIVRIRQHGRADGPRIVLSHGNGMAIDGYFPFWDKLRDRFEIVVFDFRNHGRNPVAPISGHNWENFITDLEAIFQAINQELGDKPAAGVFHSMSAVAATLHALRYGKRFDALVLFDPPYMPSADNPFFNGFKRNEKGSMAERARRRTARYKDPGELAQQFQRRFKWVPEAFELMARATLRHDTAADDWILACPREYEAEIFSSNSSGDVWNRMKLFDAVPYKLVSGDPKFGMENPVTVVVRALAEHLGVGCDFIPDTTHFMQLEKPHECISIVESFLAKHNLAQ